MHAASFQNQYPPLSAPAFPLTSEQPRAGFRIPGGDPPLAVITNVARPKSLAPAHKKRGNEPPYSGSPILGMRSGRCSPPRMALWSVSKSAPDRCASKTFAGSKKAPIGFAAKSAEFAIHSRE
jgi:hypothetical protein